MPKMMAACQKLIMQVQLYGRIVVVAECSVQVYGLDAFQLAMPKLPPLLDYDIFNI
jgi:hypothetical protein